MYEELTRPDERAIGAAGAGWEGASEVARAEVSAAGEEWRVVVWRESEARYDSIRAAM